MKKLGLLLAAAAMVAFAGGANAGSLSSSKVAFALGDLSGLGVEACDQAGPNAGACETGASTDDTGFVDVMQTFIKTPNGKELSFDVALQCALITFTEAKAKGSGKTGGSGGAASEGRISVRVVVDDVDQDGEVIPDTTRYALPDNDGNSLLATGAPPAATGPEGVTYCSRFQELAVSFESLVCLYDETEDPDDECIIAVSLLLKTLNASSFNFVMANLTSGNKMVRVQARATADASVFTGDILSSARGEAFIGMGSTRIETVRAVKAFDPDVGPLVDFIDLQ